MTDQEQLKIIDGILKDINLRLKVSPQDKIAALKSAASIIENGLNAEMTFQLYANALTNQNA